MNTPEPGFYQDPDDPSLERWWNGKTWVGQTRPANGQPPLPMDEVPAVGAPASAADAAPESDPGYPQLWDQHLGNTLTPNGWMPTASVEAQRKKVKSLVDYAWACSGLGLVICGPASLLGIGLGVAARARGEKWGVPVGWGPVILGTVAAILWLFIAVAVSLPTTSENTTTSGGGAQSQAQTFPEFEGTGYSPAEVEVGAIQPPDEYGYRSAPVTITNPRNNPGPCTFVVTVTVDSGDGSVQYDSAITSVNSLNPGQSYSAEVTFSEEFPDDAMYFVAESACIPE